MSAPPPLLQTHYELLNLPSKTRLTPYLLRKAYHQALLSHHPDKSAIPSPDSPSIDALTTAYKTLSDPALRAAYDRSLSHKQGTVGVVVQVDLDDLDEVDEGWRKRCRCGETMMVTEGMLEGGGGEVRVQCDGCSIVYVVGYEMVEG